MMLFTTCVTVQNKSDEWNVNWNYESCLMNKYLRTIESNKIIWIK